MLDAAGGRAPLPLMVVLSKVDRPGSGHSPEFVRRRLCAEVQAAALARGLLGGAGGSSMEAARGAACEEGEEGAVVPGEAGAALRARQAAAAGRGAAAEGALRGAAVGAVAALKGDRAAVDAFLGALR